MFARMSTYKAADADKLLEGFEQIRDELEHTDGLSHGYFLVDRDSGKAVSITLWDTQAAMQASTAKADELRKRGTTAGEASIESVDQFEVGMTVGTPVTA